METNAIAAIYGDIAQLRSELNLALVGSENSNGQYELSIKSTDVLCDLVSGNAKVTMYFPIKNTENYIKVSYDKLTISM